ncbi:phage terminase large subunit family protein [Amorphus orientalis]|uniref:Phage terminase large subunit GpA-like protein n=1 Tax=Amorphus orientalis TaxID=649198 RepID=A0AAE4AUQ9_9HYPH|nr:terminase gpA endonuclease subunit [Amorphus orientalis]MDQ0317713.1 phage terminase large subunit GpA-like protein [Amorphus orientalis]
MSHYERLEDILLRVAEAVRPPERLTVSDAAAKYRKIYNPGSYVGPWDNDFAPYLIEPMDVLTSLDHTAMIFAGPARCGKTDIFFNWLTHTSICDPADMMLVHMSQGTARDWSMSDLRRVFRYTPALGEKVLPGRQNMNVHDIRFLAGTRLLVKWPTINELSGKTIPRVWFTDYDRMDGDIDKEGPPFDLGRKRTQTYGRHGMTVAESSPGYEIDKADWQPSTPHEAPPTQGVLALYNRGDRRRFYWRCAHCKEPFEGDFKHISYPDSADHLEAAEAATLDCPNCGYSHTHEAGPGQPGKNELNYEGRWIREGQLWLPDRTIVGNPLRSDVASFWLKGVAAAFVDWKTLVFKYLKAIEEFEKTGNYGAWKTTVNTDQGLAFIPPTLVSDRTPELYRDRAKPLPQRVVPRDVLFLVATIDVQISRFEVQVQGVGLGGDVTIIDRFKIKYSRREDPDAPGQMLRVSPGTHLEDWHVLVEEVIERTYPLDDDSGRHMAIKATGCDSGGAAGVTAAAYNFWRWLRDECPGGHHLRFQLIKGASSPHAPRVKIAYPDSERKDRRAEARGEIPVLEINSNMIKDQVYGMLGRTEPGGGMVLFPEWLPRWFYAELTAEVRMPNKGWENPRRVSNEAWDLLCYCLAICLSRHINIENIDWGAPPSFAMPWDKNDFVFSPDEERPFEEEEDYDLGKLGASLG